MCVAARKAKVLLSFLLYYFCDKDDLMRAERILARAIERLEPAMPASDPLRAADAVLEECPIGTTENGSALIAFLGHWASCVRKGTGGSFLHESVLQLFAE